MQLAFAGTVACWKWMREQEITMPSSGLSSGDAINQTPAQKGWGRFQWSWCEQRRRRERA